MKVLSVLFLSSFIFLTAYGFSQEENDMDRLRKSRENRLSYGLNSEISELIKEFIADKDISYNAELLKLFENTKNTQIQKDILELYTVSESDMLYSLSLKKIENREYENKGVIISALRYVSSLGKDTASDIFAPLLDDNLPEYRAEAVKALCDTEDRQYSQKLMDLYNAEEETSVKLQILLHLGKLKDPSTAPFLRGIISDRDLEKTFRQYAINSLGMIRDEESFNDLLAAYQDDDPYIRIYAVSALSGYEKTEVDSIIFEALKDENWRIRKEATTAAGKKKNNDFVKILIYRSDNDPVEDIRMESIKSLSEIGSNEAMDYIRNKAADPKSSLKIRKHAFSTAVEKDLPGSMKMVEAIIEKEWNSSNKALLESSCSELSKIKSPLLDSYFEKMLDHSSIVVKISGLKGIRLNRISSLREKVKAISEDSRQSVSVKNNALSALENL